MASVALSAESVLPISKLEVHPVAQSARMRVTAWPWRAVADTASGLTFLGVLGWAVWHIGSVLLQLVPQVAATGGGYLF